MASSKLSMRSKLIMSLSAVAAVLLLSSIISVMEYENMSTYVSDLIADDIRSINVARKLSDVSNNYNLEILAVIGDDANSEIPEFDDEYFENGDDVVPFLDYDWTKRDFVRSTISRQSLVHLYLNWLVEKRGDIFYHVSGVSDGKLVEFLNENLAL